MKYNTGSPEAVIGKTFRRVRSTLTSLTLAVALMLALAGGTSAQLSVPEIRIEVKAAFQGFFDPDSKTLSKNIEAELILRDAISPDLIHARKTITFDRNTMKASVTFSRLFLTEAYISIKSKNSIETFSKEPVVLEHTELNSYDFTTGKSQAYGSNMLEYDFGGPKIATLYVGDVNADGIVDGTDYGLVENDALNYATGDLPTDLTGDEFVDGTDMLIVEQNSNDYIQAMIPPGSVAKPVLQTGKKTFELMQNYPNPFNPSTVISFGLKDASSVKLSVFDMSGRELAVLVNQNLMPGNHSFKWDASNLASGTYFYRLDVDGEQLVKQMQLVK
ncbi:MAG: T9SS type A sorting domain-containing protein [Ignavibacteria bacterium]|nr:T9SS type A sorting domain-containing protein [Ignavibacteria bacterium]